MWVQIWHKIRLPIVVAVDIHDGEFAAPTAAGIHGPDIASMDRRESFIAFSFLYRLPGEKERELCFHQKFFPRFFCHSA